MTSTFTPNKGIEQPASGDYVNAWATPVNQDWAIIDKSLGGTTSINVTSVAAGTYALTLTQYQPINIEFIGTLSANLNYQIPTGVGGMWTIANATSGSGSTLSFSIAAGNSLVLPLNRSLIVSDGASVQFADLAIATAAELAAITAAEAYANATFVRLTTNVGSMTGVVVEADPGGTPSGSPGELFLYY